LIASDVNEILTAVLFGNNELVCFTAANFYLLDKLSAELHVVNNLDAFHPISVCLFGRIKIF
jgi:hypothetical protein